VPAVAGCGLPADAAGAVGTRPVALPLIIIRWRTR
jgi:hypothetical protein